MIALLLAVISIANAQFPATMTDYTQCGDFFAQYPPPSGYELGNIDVTYTGGNPWQFRCASNKINTLDVVSPAECAGYCTNTASCVAFDFNYRCDGSNGNGPCYSATGECEINSRCTIYSADCSIDADLSTSVISVINRMYFREITLAPTTSPSLFPTSSPSRNPTDSPTKSPSKYPSVSPTKSPTGYPSTHPTAVPTSLPTLSPVPIEPTLEPSSSPTLTPSVSPTVKPSSSPTVKPSSSPTVQSTSIGNRNDTVADAPVDSPTVSQEVFVVSSGAGVTVFVVSVAIGVYYWRKTQRTRSTFQDF